MTSRSSMHQTPPRLAAPVGACENLQQVTVGVFEVHAATPVASVDLSGSGPARIGPVCAPLLADAAEDPVEVVFAYQEGVMLGGNLAFPLVEIERDAVVGLDDEEGPEAHGRRQAENLGEEGRRSPLVTAPDDGMVQLHAHEVAKLAPSKDIAGQVGQAGEGPLACPPSMPARSASPASSCSSTWCSSTQSRSSRISSTARGAGDLSDDGAYHGSIFRPR